MGADKAEHLEIVPGVVLRRADLDDFAGLDPKSDEFRSRMEEHVARRKELDELEEVARVATRAELTRYEPIPEAWARELTLGTFFEGEDRLFKLYVPGLRPSDAIVLTSARVNRVTRAVQVTVTNLRAL